VKVFVCTAVKPDRLKTHRWLMNSGLDYHFSVHTLDDKNRLMDLTGMLDYRIHVMDPPEIGVGKVSWLRQHLQDDFTEPGEWYAFIDDDIMVAKLADPYYDLELIDRDAIEFIDVDWREEFVQPLKVRHVRLLLEEIKAKCIEVGTIFGGITWNENYYFRLKKWLTKSFVCGGFCVTMNDPDIPWRFHPEVHLNEDAVRSLFVMEKFGTLVVNQFATIAPLEPNQDFSSIGPLERRRAAWKWSCKTLEEEFRGLIRLKPKENGDIQLVWKGQKSIDAWRRTRGHVG